MLDVVHVQSVLAVDLVVNCPHFVRLFIVEQVFSLRLVEVEFQQVNLPHGLGHRHVGVGPRLAQLAPVHRLRLTLVELLQGSQELQSVHPHHSFVTLHHDPFELLHLPRGVPVLEVVEAPQEGDPVLNMDRDVGEGLADSAGFDLKVFDYFHFGMKDELKNGFSAVLNKAVEVFDLPGSFDGLFVVVHIVLPEFVSLSGAGM